MIFVLLLKFLFSKNVSRSADCFSLGWPMRDDGDFFKSTRDLIQAWLLYEGLSLVSKIIAIVSTNCANHSREERLHAEKVEALGNQTSWRPAHFGTFIEVLIACGRSMFWLYRFAKD